MWMNSQDDRDGFSQAVRIRSLKDWDWIHPESLASDEVWQALLDLASDNVAIYMWMDSQDDRDGFSRTASLRSLKLLDGTLTTLRLHWSDERYCITSCVYEYSDLYQ